MRILPLVRLLITILAVAGIVVSVLALRIHYSNEVAACSINEKWDCGLVNHSPYAQIGPVPVAALGIVGYALIGVVAWLPWAYPVFLMSASGCVFALYLTFIEEFVLNVWCLYCVISQSIILLLTLITFTWFTIEYIAGVNARNRLMWSSHR